jgi:hypothetical protein
MAENLKPSGNFRKIMNTTIDAGWRPYHCLRLQIVSARKGYDGDIWKDLQ